MDKTKIKLGIGILLLSSIAGCTALFYQNTDKKEEVKKEKIETKAFEENDKKRSKYKGYTVEEVYINGKLEKIDVQSHGDHYHIIFNGKKYSLDKEQYNKLFEKDNKIVLQELVEKTLENLKENDIISYEKHGDHWHVKTKDGEFITYEDPSKLKSSKDIKEKAVQTISRKELNNLSIKTYYKHGDHWHIVTTDGREYVSYENPYGKKTIDKIVNKVESKPILNKNTNLFDKVVDHGDHVHVWVRGIEYSINRELYNEFVRNNKFDEKKARGEIGDNYSDEIDDKLKREIEYISRVYGVPVEAIKYSDEFFSFNDPGHEYDPTHIHPYFVPRSKFRIPEVIGIPEIDFENELLALSERTGIAPNKIKVENGKFVLSHGDHNHYLNILTTGYEDYIKNRLPDIEGKKIDGEFNREIVEKKINELLEQNDKIYTDIVLNRRRKRVLLEFKDRINENANSTEGYLLMLDEFDKLYINVVEGANKTELDELTVEYNELLKRIESKNDVFFTSLKTTKDEIIKMASDSLSLKEELYKTTFIFNELERFSGRYAIVGMGYVDYLVKNVESNLISPELKEEISTVLLEMNANGQRGFFRPQFWTMRLININLKLTKELSGGKIYDYGQLPKYDELTKSPNIIQIKSFLKSIEKMIDPVVKPEINKY